MKFNYDGKTYDTNTLKKGDIIGDPQNGYKYLGGKGLWANFKNLRTGEETLKVHNLKKVSSWDKCKHYWELIDNNGNIQCKKCKLGQKIVWGKYIVKNGKLDKLKK